MGIRQWDKLDICTNGDDTEDKVIISVGIKRKDKVTVSVGIKQRDKVVFSLGIKQKDNVAISVGIKQRDNVDMSVGISGIITQCIVQSAEVREVQKHTDDSSIACHSWGWRARLGVVGSGLRWR